MRHCPGWSSTRGPYAQKNWKNHAYKILQEALGWKQAIRDYANANADLVKGIYYPDYYRVHSLTTSRISGG